MSLPLIMLQSGPQPQSVTDLNAQIIQLATQLNPGLTANLPGTLIEDIASTDTAALSLIDQAQIELLNSMTPYGANLFLLNQLGQIYGVQQGVETNTSVYVVFSGPVGFLIPQGFIVSDGNYQYVTQDNSIIASSGSSFPVYCVANSTGSWAVPANTVVFTATSIPAAITVTCTNPEPGTPSSGTETTATYRARVLQAGLVTATGTPQMIKTLLTSVNGVNPQLISVKLNNYYNNWEIIVGGGDPYAVANAIYLGCGDPNSLCGSAMVALSITNANPGVVTTSLYHGFSTGQVVQISGAGGMTGINSKTLVLTGATWSSSTVTLTASTAIGFPTGTSLGVVVTGMTPSGYNGTFTATVTGTYTMTYSLSTNPGTATVFGDVLTGYHITVINNTQFSLGVDTTSLGTYVSSSALIAPNNRNQVVSVNSIPDTYVIPFVVPVQQSINIAITWNTIATNLTANTTVTALATPVVISYINALEIGQPVNLIELQTLIATSLVSVIPTEQLITLTFVITINGQITSPASGTQAIYGDPESYYYMTSGNVTFTKVV